MKKHKIDNLEFWTMKVKNRSKVMEFLMELGLVVLASVIVSAGILAIINLTIGY